MSHAADSVKKAAVIGAGVMGAGIAAHLANAGCEVVLLDIAVDGADPARLARDAVARQVKVGGFMHPALAAEVTVGTTDDLSLVADCDWVVEAIVELPEVKKDLYARLDAVMKPDAILSSNTSTIPLATLVAGLPPQRASHFLITHFFNPPRYMRLLELVTAAETAPEAAARIRDFADRRLGKSVVACKDTPGFLANRIGCFWMLAAVRYAIELGLTVEDADAVIGKPFGIPGTGIFGLTDLVGIDLMPKVWSSFATTLPSSDAFHGLFAPLPVMETLVERGTVGRKAGAGFYRKGKAGMEALDLTSLDYRPQQKSTLPCLAEKSLAAVMAAEDKGGRYAWAVMSATLAYAAALVPEISDSLAAIDEAMRLGYNWKEGPFELIDRLGADVLATRLQSEGRAVPPLLAQAVQAGGFYRESPSGRLALSVTGMLEPVARPAGVVLVADFRRAGAPVQGNAAASLWDMGDGVACLEFHRKMNAMAPESMDAIEAATARASRDFRALVVGNDAPTFCAGADLSLFLAAIEREDRPFVDDFVRRGQSVYAALQAAPLPVVGAVAGMALGGGCEVLLHCDRIQAHAETSIGLVERNVGLIPAWGGCLQTLLRALAAESDPLAAAKAAFQRIATASVSGSARLARDLGVLRPVDSITMNRDRLLADAKALALSLAEAGYQAPVEQAVLLPAETAAVLGSLSQEMAEGGLLTGHDLAIADVLISVFSAAAGEAVSQQVLRDREREGFVSLAFTPATRERIAHMLKTGKPLKN